MFCGEPGKTVNAKMVENTVSDILRTGIYFQKGTFMSLTDWIGRYNVTDYHQCTQ